MTFHLEVIAISSSYCNIDTSAPPMFTPLSKCFISLAKSFKKRLDNVSDKKKTLGGLQFKMQYMGMEIYSD